MALEPNFLPRSFYEQALERDFSRDFQLRVIDIGNGFITEEDNVFIKTTSLPKYQIHNQPTNFMGMKFNIPGTAEYAGNEAWTVQFRCDLTFNIRHKIETWQHQIFTQFDQPELEIARGLRPGAGIYNVPSMERTATLALHDRSGKFYRQYSLIGVYPVSIGDMNYDQTGNGAIVDLPVTLAYQWWELDFIDCPEARMEPDVEDNC